MKISIATGPWLPVPALQGGAIPRIWHGLAEEFAANGHEVKVLCRSYSGQPSHEVTKGVEYIRWGGLPQSPNIKVDLLKDLAYAICVTPTLPCSDILIINDFWLPVFAALRSKVGKIVINANRFPKGQYGLYRNTDLFAVASSAVQNAIAEQCPPAVSRMRVIPNPIDIDIFSPPEKSRTINAEKKILYVGRLHPEKGVHLLIDAFKVLSRDMNDVNLRIVGPYKEKQGGGGTSYFNQLKSKAEGHNISFVEPIFDTKKLADEYQQADIFCYPSLAEKGESFGIAPLEAMATGLVPVVSSLQCFRDFIREDESGYFFDHRSDQAIENLAQALRDSLSKTTDVKKKSRKAIESAKNYSYSAVARLYLSEFENILSEMVGQDKS